ncbi:hypothetical protein E2C01_016652 [Portunus trituberculatus]|uniref:Uncharacterized protein n=1 Tax=Portunus trituberculatus TaxID=210409 RepID=A0A5B7DQT1_PORTR|nr:hypothetical protein [Portunus trituberculatus]
MAAPPHGDLLPLLPLTFIEFPPDLTRGRASRRMLLAAPEHLESSPRGSERDSPRLSSYTRGKNFH